VIQFPRLEENLIGFRNKKMKEDCPGQERDHSALMAVQVAREEQERLLPLSGLNILIHPLFVTHSPGCLSGYKKARTMVAQEAIKRFSPKCQSELTLIMPNLHYTKFFPQRKMMRFSKRQDPDFLGWEDIYRGMKRESGFSHNIRLVRDNIDAGMTRGLLARIEKFGFRLDPETLITFGGEWLDCCVWAAAVEVVKGILPPLVRVDKQSSVLSSCCLRGFDDYYFDDTIAPPTGYNLTRDDCYYYLIRDQQEPA
jgi:hypothetical protein